ncbi:hypothetical protein ACM14_24520 [Delftia sp. JD2]|nr:hypothetical protein A4F85_13235 [Delftia sp. GW456-R20]OBY82777.1 hypothetical protein ACM14_24520 [Delftia sp. JD2]
MQYGNSRAQVFINFPRNLKCLSVTQAEKNVTALLSHQADVMIHGPMEYDMPNSFEQRLIGSVISVEINLNSQVFQRLQSDGKLRWRSEILVEIPCVDYFQ